MSERFFLEESPREGRALLRDSEAQHLAKVLRAKVGDEVTLFDGSGAEFSAVVESLGRHEVTLTIRQRREIDRELPHELTLAVALPKGDRQQWLVEKLTELGVTRLVPLITERGVAQPVESALARLRRWVVEASKQCQRNRLLQIAPPARWPDYAALPAANAQRFIAHPGEPPPTLTAMARPAIAAIGPEGGWTEQEVAAAVSAGWQAIGLGPRILRIETAAIKFAACWGSGG